MIKVLILVLIIIIVACSFIILNLLRKIEKLEEQFENLENAYLISIDMINKTIDELHDIDRRGSFESDDEVGNTFKMIKNSVTMLQQKLSELQQIIE